MTGMQNPNSPASRGRQPDTPEVDEAERKVGAVLEDLESATDGEVRKLGLDDIVDTDKDGRPVVKKTVDIELQRNTKRKWSR